MGMYVNITWKYNTTIDRDGGVSSWTSSSTLRTHLWQLFSTGEREREREREREAKREGEGERERERESIPL